MSQNSASQTPVDKIQLGRLQAAIWKNVDQDGRIFYTYSTDRRYKDDAGNWKSTNSYSHGDALLNAKLHDLVDSRIRELNKAE